MLLWFGSWLWIQMLLLPFHHFMIFSFFCFLWWRWTADVGDRAVIIVISLERSSLWMLKTSNLHETSFGRQSTHSEESFSFSKSQLEKAQSLQYQQLQVSLLLKCTCNLTILCFFYHEKISHLPLSNYWLFNNHWQNFMKIELEYFKK